MKASTDNLDTRLLLWTFSLFAFTCTFSIALAQISLGISLGLFVAVAIRHRHNPFVYSLRWFYWAVAAWIGWLALTGLFGETPARSLWLSREEWLFGAVPVGIYLFQDNRRRHAILAAFACGVGLVGIYGLIQYPTGFNLLPHHTIVAAPGFGYRVLAAFNQYMTFSNFYAVAAAFLVGYTLVAFRSLPRGYRYLLSAGSALAILMTVLSFGRGAVASLILAVIMALLLLGRRYTRISVAAILVLIVVGIAIPGVTARYVSDFDKDASIENPGGRLFIWKHSLEVIADHSWVGVGMGNFKAAYSSKLPAGTPEHRYQTHAHNDALNVAAISGIPGLVLFGVLWLAALGHFWIGFRRERQRDPIRAAGYFGALIGSLCFAASSVTEATFVDEEVRQLLMLVWAVGLAGWYNRKSDRKVAGKGLDF